MKPRFKLPGTVAPTDHDWYEFLRDQPDLDEVNFWTPSAFWSYRAQPGTPFFFKLKAQFGGAICGFGLFAHFSKLPDWRAWEWFDKKNGSPSLEAMQERIGKIRKSFNYRSTPQGDLIGCILISQPIFFRESEFVAAPKDWPPQNLRHKGYDLSVGEGKRIWEECRMHAVAAQFDAAPVGSGHALKDQPRFGASQIIRPRLGQGAFRASVLDAYGRACSVTGEHSLPALEASHIRPYKKNGPHLVSNGILLRADLHNLFDQGYLTVTEDHRLEVSPRLKTDYHNGRTYYPFHGQKLVIPGSVVDRPDPEFLRWHRENTFLAA